MNFSKLIQAKAGKPIAKCTNRELYEALLTLVQEEAAQKVTDEGKKKIYYISAEFMIGKLLSNNLINLGWYDAVRDALAIDSSSGRTRNPV